MTLVRVRRNAQVTLPTALRKALRIADGDYLEASLVDGGLLLRPVSVQDRQAIDQDKAWDNFMLRMTDMPAEADMAATDPDEAAGR